VVLRRLLLVVVVTLVLAEIAAWAVYGWFEWSIRNGFFLWTAQAERQHLTMVRTKLAIGAVAWTVVQLVVLTLAGFLAGIVRRRARAWGAVLVGIQVVDAGLAVFSGIRQLVTYGENDSATWVLAVIPVVVIALLAMATTLTRTLPAASTG